MKPGNLVLTLMAVMLLALAWMLVDTSDSKPRASGSGDAAVKLAVASGQPVLLEFYADWCGPCRAVAPLLEELSQEWQGKARIVRVNVDTQPALAQAYKVRGIPAFVVLRDGKETRRAVGGLPKEAIRGLVF